MENYTQFKINAHKIWAHMTLQFLFLLHVFRHGRTYKRMSLAPPNFTRDSLTPLRFN